LDSARSFLVGTLPTSKMSENEIPRNAPLVPATQKGGGVRITLHNFSGTLKLDGAVFLLFFYPQLPTLPLTHIWHLHPLQACCPLMASLLVRWRRLVNLQVVPRAFFLTLRVWTTSPQRGAWTLARPKRRRACELHRTPPPPPPPQALHQCPSAPVAMPLHPLPPPLPLLQLKSAARARVRSPAAAPSSSPPTTP